MKFVDVLAIESCSKYLKCFARVIVKTSSHLITHCIAFEKIRGSTSKSTG